MRRVVGVMLTLVSLWGVGCSDAGLYSSVDPRRQADRVALSGRVCSEDPVEARFPVRVVLLVDQAAGPLYSAFDVGSTRLDAMEDFIQVALTSPTTELAVVGYAGRPRKLAPVEGDFTRNPGELINAIGQTALAQGCLGEERCRDRREAIRTARALIEGDLVAQPAGLRVLTQYVVIMINAGPQAPMALGRDCCAADDVECIDAGGDPSPACEAQLEAEEVAALREVVAESGAAGLRFHTIQLAAEASQDTNLEIQAAMEGMAFAGGGIFQRFDSPGGLAFKALELLGLRTLLRAKLLVAANLNAKPSPQGPRVDSDADGLADAEERGIGTDITTPDTDGDGIGDYVETLVGLDPTVADAPRACDSITPGADRDLDRLTDCDEELLGTSPTLVDSDGDGMPDRLEIVALTDYIERDAEQDADGDGVSNGDEILLHADPRSTDTREHLSSGYRYEIEDEGTSVELFASKPERITGVEVVSLSEGTTPGVGTLVWEAQSQTLRWQDALDGSPGPPVVVSEGGEFELPSSSWAPIQGESGKVIRVEVDPAELSGESTTEVVRVVFRERQCLSYMIRNIRLMATEARADGTPAGMNDVLLYFAQSPEGRLEVPGPFRMAQIPITFTPPTERSPDGAVLEVRDEEFVRPRF